MVSMQLCCLHIYMDMDMWKTNPIRYQGKGPFAGRSAHCSDPADKPIAPIIQVPNVASRRSKHATPGHFVTIPPDQCTSPGEIPTSKKSKSQHDSTPSKISARGSASNPSPPGPSNNAATATRVSHFSPHFPISRERTLPRHDPCGLAKPS